MSLLYLSSGTHEFVLFKILPFLPSLNVFKFCSPCFFLLLCLFINFFLFQSFFFVFLSVLRPLLCLLLPLYLCILFICLFIVSLLLTYFMYIFPHFWFPLMSILLIHFSLLFIPSFQSSPVFTLHSSIFLLLYHQFLQPSSVPLYHKLSISLRLTAFEITIDCTVMFSVIIRRCFLLLIRISSDATK
jgi:hypothetical protein